MSFLWTLLWKFLFFFNWSLEFPRSSIPLEIPCLPHPCHLFGLDFFWNKSVLLVKSQSSCLHLGQVHTYLKQQISRCELSYFRFPGRKFIKNLPKTKDFNHSSHYKERDRAALPVALLTFPVKRSFPRSSVL